MDHTCLIKEKASRYSSECISTLSGMGSSQEAPSNRSNQEKTDEFLQIIPTLDITGLKEGDAF